MKILCFTDGFMYGGAERQLIGLANLLQKNKYDVTLASYHKKNFYKLLIDECNLHYHYIQTGNSQWSKLYNCYKYFKNEKFDWIISYKGGSNQICCILKALGMNYKLLVSERCLVYNFNNYQKKKFFLYRFADSIVPNSQAQEKFIAEHYPNLSSRTETITNFTDTNHFIPLTNKTNSSKQIILVAARISKQKNIKRFIEAIKLLHEEQTPIIVKWFGSVSFGEDNYAQECYHLVTEYNLDQMFLFHPATTNISEEYQKCDVFCLPSIFEGFPNVVCEAMSCGKPILCSDVCDNASIVEDGKNGFLFNPESVEDIVLKIKKMIKLSSTERKKMGEYSRQLAIQNFSEESFVKKYISIIER